MSIAGRLDRLAPVLSAKQRVLLVIGALKEGKPEDPLWRTTIPAEQRDEFNRLIRLYNNTNQTAYMLYGMLDAMTRAVEMKRSWLVTLHLWTEHVEEIGLAVCRSVPEPITATEYAEKLAQVRLDWLPAAHCAELLTQDHEGWGKEDYEEVEGYDEPCISDAAWNRVLDENRRRLSQLSQNNELVSRGKGSRLQLQRGSFDDWRGVVTNLKPKALWRYRVVPDEEGDSASRERALQDLLRRSLGRASDSEHEAEPDVLPRHLLSGLQESISYEVQDLWKQARAGEIVLEEVTNEFGVDPLRQSIRDRAARLRERLIELQRDLAYLEIEFELPEPEDELLVMVREMVRR